MFLKFKRYFWEDTIYIDPYKVVAVTRKKCTDQDNVVVIWMAGDTNFNVYGDLDSVIHQIEEAVNR